MLLTYWPIRIRVLCPSQIVDMLFIVFCGWPTVWISILWFFEVVVLCPRELVDMLFWLKVFPNRCFPFKIPQFLLLACCWIGMEHLLADHFLLGWKYRSFSTEMGPPLLLIPWLLSVFLVVQISTIHCIWFGIDIWGGESPSPARLQSVATQNPLQSDHLLITPHHLPMLVPGI